MRLFLAISLSEGALQRACDVQTQLRSRITRQGVRFTAPHKIHLTLAFLGNGLEPDEADRTTGAAAPGDGPLQLTLGGIGAFPGLARPKTIWLGVSGDGLSGLAGRVGAAFGLDPAPFAGHVTLARVSPASKAVGRLLQAFLREADRADVSWIAEELHLIASHPNGEYELLRSYRL